MHKRNRERKEIELMQISRHWRIKPQRYRLEGVRYQNGDVSLQNRPAPQLENERKEVEDTGEVAAVRVSVVAR